MKPTEHSCEHETHKVFNQSVPLENYNLLTTDPTLKDLLQSSQAEWGLELVKQLGQTLGKSEWIKKGFQINEYTPKFNSHDTRGHRIDEVDFHPAYHELMQLAFEYQIPTLPWRQDKQGAHKVRMALNYLYNQNEAGSACPLTMTFAAFPVLGKNSFTEHLQQQILNSKYDPANRPLNQKDAATLGMAMTEKQGGTDVRANTSFADPLDDDRQEFSITGHKWFCSAPMCDAFLTLAQTEQGLSCFLLPRWKPDGSKNGMLVQRLKNKMGNRSNASSEVEFRNAYAQLLGEEGRGVAVIIEMVALTRYDCMIGSSALMRQALVQVIHHCSQRKVFGKTLIDQPLMQNVMADLCLESEASLMMTARVADALDNGESDLVRLMTAVGKYWICKRASSFIGEAQECLGGLGYIEDSILSRLYREAPVNSIWEGSGNVQCLDVLRALHKEPESLAAFMDELQSASGINDDYDAYLQALTTELPQINESQARFYVERLGKAMAACQLLKQSPEFVANAYIESRLKRARGLNYGCLSDDIDLMSVINRSFIAPN
ncbi:MAG: acyl-CoA dehydrogenase family protein [Xanthomonadales bacterium]|nr:acyl-CoA dehydrogenase family protein [Xanthomonadales bacterium]